MHKSKLYSCLTLSEKAEGSCFSLARLSGLVLIFLICTFHIHQTCYKEGCAVVDDQKDQFIENVWCARKGGIAIKLKTCKNKLQKLHFLLQLSLGVEDGALQAYNSDFEIQFAHKLSMMTRFSQADLDPCTFLYLLREDAEQLLYCYLFQATKPTDVSNI